MALATMLNKSTNGLPQSVNSVKSLHVEIPLMVGRHEERGGLPYSGGTARGPTGELQPIHQDGFQRPWEETEIPRRRREREKRQGGGRVRTRRKTKEPRA
ncbi:hypothetical protein NDU88_000768 [Pleurodeles waltl]|uniref:Uncharacterized protein n=1 Tax=Pleurodeles waltl TaxID=8319 RepID=A0AAV7KP71_PLEWA|nr:hypothetical protein NDU88_000768 [Pleurodeles waltl]